MLDLIPRPLHRALLRLAHAGRICWWRVRRPLLKGCRALAIDSENRVLLVRHTYGRNEWLPPGGAVRRGENAMAAAMRELREETACTLEAPREVAQITVPLHGARNEVSVIVGRTTNKPIADGREIREVRFFALDALPPGLPHRLGPAIREWVETYLQEEERRSQ